MFNLNVSTNEDLVIELASIKYTILTLFVQIYQINATHRLLFSDKIKI